jgi:hypothetical protein
MTTFSELFHERVFTGKHEDRYQSTKFPELTSSTFKLGRQNFCVHCGAVSLPVQNTIRFFNGEFNETDYSKAGYRCTCDKAIDEIASNLAYEMSDFDPTLNPNRSSLRISDEVTQSALSVFKVINIDIISSTDNGKVTRGFSKEAFLHENKEILSMYATDAYYSDRPLTYVRETGRHPKGITELGRRKAIIIF